MEERSVDENLFLAEAARRGVPVPDDAGMYNCKRLPSLDLSGQELGGATMENPPFLIGGSWDVIDLSRCRGHAVIRGFANRVILDGSCGIFVRFKGAFLHIKARGVLRDLDNNPSWIEVSGDVFMIDLHKNIRSGFMILPETNETASGQSETDDPLSDQAIWLIDAEDSGYWREEIDRGRETALQAVKCGS